MSHIRTIINQNNIQISHIRDIAITSGIEGRSQNRMSHIGKIILLTPSEITELTYKHGTNPLSPIPYHHTELDSRANMIVMGKRSFVFDQVQNRIYEVDPYDPSVGAAKKVHIVDAAIAYDCEYTSKTYILIFRNAPHVPTLDYNLIISFILNEAGITCYDRLKIYCTDPSIEDHCIIHKNSTLRILLKLNEIFSSFHPRTPAHLEMENEDKLFFTPNSENWNPYSKHYSENVVSMLHWQGEVIPMKIRQKSLSEDKTNDEATISLIKMNKFYDKICNSAFNASISSLQIFTSQSQAQIDHQTLANAINHMHEHFSFKASIGSTHMNDDSCILFERSAFMTIHEFEAIVGAISVKSSDKLPPEFSSKIWRIDTLKAKGVIEQNTQRFRKGNENSLSRQFSTNDRLL